MKVSKEQQLEGLKAVWSRVSFKTFLLALKRLVAAKFLTKSERHQLIKWAREHYGISYEEFRKLT